MFRYLLAVSAWCLLTAVATAEIISNNQQVIDFTQPEQAAKLATWSDPERLSCTKDGFGWDGEERASRDGWIETEALAIGTNWRPTQNAGIRVKFQTNYPAVVATGANSKMFLAPSVYVRFSADRVHWSDWQPTDIAEDPRAPGTVLYTARVGVPRRASQAYDAKLLEWSGRDDNAWGNDEEEFCRWLVKEDPDYFAKERPFVGYVQFLLEGPFRGSQRLTSFEAHVDWVVSGVHQPPKGPGAEKRMEMGGWNFRGDDGATRQKE
jgi:hypothetical protein